MKLWWFIDPFVALMVVFGLFGTLIEGLWHDHQAKRGEKRKDPTKDMPL